MHNQALRLSAGNQLKVRFQYRADNSGWAIIIIFVIRFGLNLLLRALRFCMYVTCQFIKRRTRQVTSRPLKIVDSYEYRCYR